tara:strand:- start:1430 stop:1624 length:195 start_codon:yes stop_codon:yes gene_type:complete
MMWRIKALGTRSLHAFMKTFHLDDKKHTTHIRAMVETERFLFLLSKADPEDIQTESSWQTSTEV